MASYLVHDEYNNALIIFELICFFSSILIQHSVWVEEVLSVQDYLLFLSELV